MLYGSIGNKTPDTKTTNMLSEANVKEVTWSWSGLLTAIGTFQQQFRVYIEARRQTCKTIAIMAKRKTD